MSTHSGAAHKAAVIIDLENAFGVVSKREIPFYHRRIQKFIKNLPKALAPHKLVPSYYVAMACVVSGKNKKLRVDAERQDRLTKAVWDHEVMVSWCKDVIADTALIHEVECRLKEGSLPKGVIFVTDDQDFIPLAQRLSETGHTVLNVGYMSYSMRGPWCKAVHKVLHLGDILRA